MSGVEEAMKVMEPSGQKEERRRFTQEERSPPLPSSSEGEESDGGDSWIVLEEEEEEEKKRKGGNLLKILEEEEKDPLIPSTSSDSTFVEDRNFYAQDENVANHKKSNPSLNLIITASVIIGLSGFVCLGWSESLKNYWLSTLKEESDFNKENSAVDEKSVIERLKLKNRELRNELGETDILRKRIKGLLLDKSHLEDEVVQLRINQDTLSSKETLIELRKLLDETNSALKETKENLNDIINENEVLKIQVGKARYGRPISTLEEKNKINELVMENEELKKEVRKIRYTALPSVETETKFIYQQGLFDEDLHIPNPSGTECGKRLLNDIKEFLEDYATMAYVGLRSAKNRYAKDFQHIINTYQNQIFSKIGGFSQRLGVEDKIIVTKKVINNFGDAVFSAYQSVKDYSIKTLSNVKKNVNYEYLWFFRSGQENEINENLEQRQSVDDESSTENEPCGTTEQTYRGKHHYDQQEIALSHDHIRNWMFERANAREKERKANEKF